MTSLKSSLFSTFAAAVLILAAGCLPLTPVPTEPGDPHPPDTESLPGSAGYGDGPGGESGLGLSARELIDEARTMVCAGAGQYLEGHRRDALANMDAAMLNLQLADLPEYMQTIGFFQPYLNPQTQSVDLEKVYAELKVTETSDEEDVPETSVVTEIPFSGTEEEFIESEILRFMENLGSEPPKPEDLEVFSREVEHFIRYYQSARRDWFDRSYYRMLKYRNSVERIFSEKRLPSELVYLAFIESGYLYRATSRSNARGIWQFIRSTGRNYGLRVERHVDERLDPLKSTVAAREYLLDLISIFGSRSFLLAMASYNAGEGKVQKCLRALDDPFENRSFWKIRECLRRETQEYIPRIIAAGIICENPKRFGFDFPTLDEYSARYDLVICPLIVKLSSVAEAAGISLQQLSDINPDLPSGGSWTPVTNTHLWIPSGTGPVVTAELSKMASRPPPEVPGGDYHSVRKGDNLYQIGRRYKIPYKKLADWNTIAHPYKIKPGQKIYLHPPGSAPGGSTAQAGKSRCDETLVYIVQKGNYLAAIGAMFGTSARDIMTTNNLDRGTIFPGQRLLICPGFPVDIIQHSVSPGETLSRIARKYKVGIDDIKFINGIRDESLIRVGQKLTLYRKSVN